MDANLGYKKSNKNINKILDLKDAFSQTSDTETKYYEEHHKRASQRKIYDQRRLTTEGLIQSGQMIGTDEANNYVVMNYNLDITFLLIYFYFKYSLLLLPHQIRHSNPHPCLAYLK